MPLMSSELYTALLDIGVEEEKARKAAEAAALPNRDIAELRADVAAIKASLVWIQVFLGLNLTLTLLILGKLFVFAGTP